MAEGGLEGMDKIKSSVTIQKVTNIMKNKHTSEMIERHVKALNKISQNNKTGFLLHELYDLCQLFSTCSERLHRTPEYIEPLCQLVELCSLPFLKEKMSDENMYAPQVIDTLSWLGRLAKGKSDPLRARVAKAVAAFYSEQPNHALKQGLQMTKLTFNAALVERSGVATSLVEAVPLCADHHVRLDILRALQLLSSTPTNANHILSVGGAQIVCDTLSLHDPDHQLLFTSVEVLWNLLENGSQLQVASQLSNIDCISILRGVFCELMVESDKGVQNRQLRNDMLMICSRIAQLCPDAPFVESGFLKELCYFASFSDEPSAHHPSSPLRFTQDHEDFELKKALICLLTSLCSNGGAAIRVLRKEKTLRSLLSYVVPNEGSSQWNPAQFEELQLLVLSSLATLAPQCVEDYMLCQGNTRILLLIEWCTQEQGTFKGHGNSFHGDSGRGNRLSQLRYSLRLLLSMCSGGDEMITRDLHEQGVIPLLISILKRLFESDQSDLPVLLEIQADILLITSSVCEVDMHRKELFGGYDGVTLVISYLKRNIAHFGSGLGHHRLLLAATDCVWCGVVGNPIVEDIFLESEGIFVLLDILQVCPVNMQSLVLGVLVDLCENPKAIAHVVSWRGSGDKAVWSLLAELWRREERDMEVPRGTIGTLAGTSQPLMGAEQSTCGVAPLPTLTASPAVTDITENMRAKIYALCCKMGFQYTIEGLPTEDRVTLCIVESYLDFKSGEVWYEVAGELTQEGLRPVTPDQECLTNILQTHEEKAEETLRIQGELIDEQKKCDEEDEHQFYVKINQLRQGEEKAKRDFIDFLQRTSNYKLLQEAKQKQVSALDSSGRSNVAIGNQFHSLEQSGLNVTTFCGRHVSIATTPMKLLAENIVSMHPSSSCDEHTAPMS